MEDKLIDTLITELKNLKVREAEIISQLETANRQRGRKSEKVTEVSNDNSLSTGDRVQDYEPCTEARNLDQRSGLGRR
jgi:hypothetical protein